MPLIVRHSYKRYKAKKDTKKILAKLAQIDPFKFDELSLNNRVTNVFQRVHAAWSNQDL